MRSESAKHSHNGYKNVNQEPFGKKRQIALQLKSKGNYEIHLTGDSRSLLSITVNTLFLYCAINPRTPMIDPLNVFARSIVSFSDISENCFLPVDLSLVLRLIS